MVMANRLPSSERARRGPPSSPSCRTSFTHPPLPVPHPGEEERGLIHAVVARGDQRAFETLYDRHTPALYALALRLSGGHESDAQDVVHDTWVRAVVRLQSFD